MRYVEKQVILQALDHLWREHLVTLDHLRQVIGWRGMAQRDPLNEYKSEAFELFRELITQWHEAVIAQMSRVEVRFQQPEPPPPPMQYQHLDPATGENELPPSPFSENRWRYGSCGGLRRRSRRPRSEQSCDMGPGWTKRTLPVRLGQEVQTLPRPGRLTIGAALRASTARAEALACLVETFEACGIEDPKREAGITLSRGVRRFAARVDRRPAGAARIRGRGRSRNSRRGGRPASRCQGSSESANSGVSRSRFRRRFWIRGPRPKRSSKHALRLLRDRREEPLRILDLGVGSGALLCALLSEFVHARGVGVDVSAAAANVARSNIEACGLAGRAEIRLGDWTRGLDGPL